MTDEIYSGELNNYFLCTGRLPEKVLYREENEESDLTQLPLGEPLRMRDFVIRKFPDNDSALLLVSAEDYGTAAEEMTVFFEFEENGIYPEDETFLYFATKTGTPDLAAVVNSSFRLCRHLGKPGFYLECDALEISDDEYDDGDDGDIDTTDIPDSPDDEYDDGDDEDIDTTDIPDSPDDEYDDGDDDGYVAIVTIDDIDTDTAPAIDNIDTDTAPAIDDIDTDTAPAIDDIDTDTAPAIDDIDTDTAPVIDDIDPSVIRPDNAAESVAETDEEPETVFDICEPEIAEDVTEDAAEDIFEDRPEDAAEDIVDDKSRKAPLHTRLYGPNAKKHRKIRFRRYGYNK